MHTKVGANVITVKAKLAGGFALTALFISWVRVRNLRRLILPHQPAPLSNQLVALQLR